LPSASTAPRCQTARSASIAASTTRREALPSVAATMPTPQASDSMIGAIHAFGFEPRVIGGGVMGHIMILVCLS
jgi:hypothetical protein